MRAERIERGVWRMTTCTRCWRECAVRCLLYDEAWVWRKFEWVVSGSYDRFMEIWRGVE